MCNTNNTELIRQQLWCDFIKSNNGELTFDKVLAEADKVVAEFDKRFNTKLSCQESGKSQSYIGEILDFRYDDEVEKIDNSDCILDKRTLRELYFGENDFYDVSRLADVDEGLTYWAGRSENGINILVKCKRNNKLRRKDDAPFDFRTKTSFINSERVKNGFSPIETLNTDREPPIINTSFKENTPLRDTTTYIERGLKPREIVRTESTQVAPAPPKNRTIQEPGFSFKNLFGFKNNQDSFE